MQFKCKYGLIVKNVSISSYSVYSIHFSIESDYNIWICVRLLQNTSIPTKTVFILLTVVKIIPVLFDQI